MRLYLARVVRTHPLEVILTGNPADDVNADLVVSAQPGPGNDWTRPAMVELLDKVEAVRIDSILAGHLDQLPDGSPDIARGAALFAALLATRSPIYP